MVQEAQAKLSARVAFPIVDRTKWTGGYNYLLNLFRVLRRYAPDRVTPVLFHGPDTSADDLAPFLALANQESVCSPHFSEAERAKRVRGALLRGQDARAEAIFRERKIDVAFESATFFGWRFAIPAVAWFPDFQHRLLRDMFSRSAYWRRELGYRAQTFGRRAIMVSSQDARTDCERWYGRTRGRVHVVPFAVQVDQTSLSESPQAVRERYGLPEKYFFLPNQFWKHKNHRVVIEAVSRLRASGTEVCVAASGQARDHRHSQLFDELRQGVIDGGIQERFRFLGLVPYRDVLGLMRACTALINPSYCEGWSTPVEEAKSLGVPMILSNLGVHREQAGDQAVYFDPDSPAELADCMKRHLTRALPDSASRELMAAQGVPVRLAKFASDFSHVVEAAA